MKETTSKFFGGKSRHCLALFLSLALSASVTVVSAQDAPALPPVKFSGFIQFWTQDFNNSVDAHFQHARFKLSALADEQTTLVVMPDVAPATNSLLDAYVVHNFGEQWLGTAGQFKFAFGDDRYLTPIQLKRVDYAKMDKFVFPGNPWDMGFEVKKTLDDLTVQADLIQGAGPNVLKDSNSLKDWTGRVEWKKDGFLLGGSYYGGTGNATGFGGYQNWYGAHARYQEAGFDARVEGVWAPMSKTAYLAQVAYRTGDFEPLVYGELGTIGSVQNYDLLGAGLNFWMASKTRLSLDVTLNGVTDLSGAALGVFQIEQVF